MSIRKNLIAVSIAATALLALTVTADAKCTKLASSVNDYGKVGPAKDAQALLDKQIAENMAKRGVKTYNTGKKEVTCELFLDFGVFDEYTCKAAATVCWNEGGGTAPGGANNPDTPFGKVGDTGDPNADAEMRCNPGGNVDGEATANV